MNSGPVDGAGAHEAAVRDFFSVPKLYLHRVAGIRIRQEIVLALLHEVRIGRVLDVGCGDGSISRPLLAAAESVTLVDISAPMLALAEQGTPPEWRGKVAVRCGSCEEVLAAGAGYDTILAIGLIAHLSDLERFGAAVRDSLAPGGHLLLQFSRWEHPLVKLRHWMRRRRYPLARTSTRTIRKMLARHGLEVVASRRSGLLLPGMGRLPDGMLYRYEKTVLDRKMLSSLGSEVILLARKAAR